VSEGEEVLCSRCGALLFVRRVNSVPQGAALMLAAAIFFVLANSFPFLSLRTGFRESEMVLWQSVLGLEDQGYLFLAFVVATFILVAPALIISGFLYLLLPLMADRRWRGSAPLFRWIHYARRWNMVEVYLLGAIVSLVRLQRLAVINLGTSFWSFAGLIVCLMAAVTAIDYHELWERLERAKS
jgi:paraquat-inducible protein A